MDMSKPRPAYVTFDVRAVEDRNSTIEKGRPVYKDVHFAYVTPMGSKDRIELIVDEWFAMLQGEVAANRFEQSWLDNYKATYNNWLRGLDTPVDGVPLRNWPGLTPAMLKTLNGAQIYTVEDVACMNEEAIAAVGMGARALKQRATEWLRACEDTGKVSEEVSALKVENEELKSQLELIRSEFKALKASIASEKEGSKSK